MVLLQTLLVGVIISNVNSKPDPGLFNLFDKNEKETTPTIHDSSTSILFREPKEIPSYRKMFKASDNCKTLFYRLAFICTITAHYEYEKELKLGRKDLEWMDRRMIQKAICPCPQGNISPFCPKFISNILKKYSHEIVCSAEYDLDLPLY